jgi:magnesium chelatase subunit I
VCGCAGPAPPTRGGVRVGPGWASRPRRRAATESPASVASAVEFVLEGLHLHRRLNKDRLAGSIARYRG